MSSASPTPSAPTVLLGARQRALHVLGGGLLMLLCAALALGLWALTRAEPLFADLPLGRGVLGTCGLLGALGAGWGGLLVARGVRGARHVSERAPFDPSHPPGLAVLTLASALVFVLCDGRPGSRSGDGMETLLWYGLTCGPWLVPAVTLHALGQAAATAALGLGWTAPRLGPLQLFRAEGRLRVRWHCEDALSLMGFTRFEPDALHARPDLLAWAALAGPAASLLGAGALASLAYALGGTGPVEAQGLTALLWGGAFFHAALGLVHLKSFQTGSGQVSDAWRWHALLRMKPASEGMRLFALLQDESLARRPREWSPSVDQVLTAAAAPDESPQTVGWLHLFALTMLLDRADFPAARALLTRLVPQLDDQPASWALDVLLQGALLRALGDAPDAARARTLLEAARPYDNNPHYTRLAEAAVLLAEGQPEAARAALLAWEETFAHEVFSCIGNQWARERLHAALGVTEAAGAPPSAEVSPAR
ncbi:hypothetical protein [Melittangium boletus]|uniref:hypothetical protein n=1 Tax=Melittangium boletus TaxID=83453 RepID=UPI003DA45C1B